MVKKTGSGNLDSAGELHNKFLNELRRSAIELQDGKTKDANKLLSSFLRENGIQVDKRVLDLGRGTTWEAFSDSLPADADSGSEKQQQYLSQVMRNVDALSEKRGRSSVQQDLSKLETRIRADKQLSRMEQAALLAVTSVARHSLDYWLEASLWNETSGVIYSKVGGVVKKDAAGAAQGAAVGAAGGTPASVAGGAIVGAIKGSAGAAIKEGAKSLWGKIKGLF